ncbi:RING/FYVE/PHD-type zinc finger family protein [Panicum miliaceum]|uniref:RING/FYVE/PHD-type zinc finger family protein n=1 Tax=Panicum miliaceum TaxID=4540 RepID=A0A3L6R9W2_PANMI|nr:RING/FYVE/PHD-type zinc finger family protein [Panicum miliaceum]
MAFHVACPITCRRVCDCELGFGAAAAAAAWAGAAAALEGFLADPWLLRPPGAGEGDGATVQVEVPPLEPGPEDGEGDARRAAAQRGADAAEDFARRLESGAYGSPVSGSLRLFLLHSFVGCFLFVLARVRALTLAAVVWGSRVLGLGLCSTVRAGRQIAPLVGIGAPVRS